MQSKPKTAVRLNKTNLKFFKKYSIIAQFKGLNERISE